MISHAIAARFSDCEFQTADSALHERAHAGDADALRELISQEKYKSELDKRNHLGCTPLRLAATGGHAEAAKVLLEAGATVDIVDVKGQTPLFVAVKNNHYDCAHVLLQYRADTGGSEDNVASPLYTAAMNGHINLVKLLIEFGANLVNPTMRVLRAFSMDPTQIALAYQEFDCVKLLLRARSKSHPDERDTTPLFHIAIKQKCAVQFLHLLHEFGISVYSADSQGKFPWQHDLSGYPEEERGRILQYLHYIRECPRGLKSQCRLCITQNLRRENKLSVTGLDSLCLPKTLIRYLVYEDVTRFTQTVENWRPYDEAAIS